MWGASLVLLLGGSLYGRASFKSLDYRVANIRRPIPSYPFYMRPYFISLVGGILPFGSIFIEMYFILTSFWNYKFYYVYGFMLLVFAILTIVYMRHHRVRVFPA